MSDDPEENIQAVRNKLALLLYLQSQRKEKMLRDDFIIFIRDLINLLKGEQEYNMDHLIGKIQRKLDALFDGFKIEEGKLFTPAIKDYLKKLDAQFISKNKKITEYLGLEV